MRKKLILSTLIVVAMLCLFAISVGATPIDRNTTVTLNGSFTMDTGSVASPVVNLYDEDGYALVWYLNADGKLVSDRAVNLITVTGNKAKFNDVSKFYGGTQQKGVVVVNLRDDFAKDGLSGIEKFDSNFQFGYYGANKNVPIQYFYFPKTATEIIDRMFQNTQLIIADIEPGTPITYMGVHAVAQTNLKEFFVPKGIPNFVERDDLGVFQDTQLEKITFEEGSQITVIPYRCFYMCKNLREVILPNSVEEIHYRAFQFSMFGTEGKLEKLVLGANFKGFKGLTSDNFYIRGAANVKVYLPATFTADNVDVNSAHQYFTNCPNITFYYCGTEAEWDRLIEKVSLGKNGAVGTDSGENIITAKANGKVVFNYSACDAFYNGVHVESTTVSYTSYDSMGTKTVSCTRNGCNHITTENIDSLFVCLGYSVTEFGKCGIVLGYSVNYDAIAYYANATGKTVKYGVFAVSKDNLGASDVFASDGTVTKGVVAADVSTYSFNSFEVKVSGFTDEYKDSKLAMGAYVETTKDGVTEYSYMQGAEGELVGKYYFVSYDAIAE